MGVIPRHYFTFNGHNSSDFGVWISGSGTYGAPSWDVDEVEVPGRNGTLHIDNGRLKNLQVTYPAFIPRGWPVKWAGFKDMLLRDPAFLRLEDTYHPDYYRLASFIGPLDPEVTAANRSGSFDVRFICRPERWLVSGEEMLSISSGDVLQNPTGFPAKPLIRVVGTGTITVGDYSVTVSANSNYTDIDCELMDAYCGTSNRNGNITTSEFPVLESGENTITYSGFSSVKITPRWWTV